MTDTMADIEQSPEWAAVTAHLPRLVTGLGGLFALRALVAEVRSRTLDYVDGTWGKYLCACAGPVLCRWHDELQAERQRRAEAKR